MTNSEDKLDSINLAIAEIKTSILEMKIEQERSRGKQREAVSDLMFMIEKRLLSLEKDQSQDSAKWNWASGIVTPIIVTLVLPLIISSTPINVTNAQRSPNTPIVASYSDKRSSTRSRTNFRHLVI